jgi:hypothetical protein
MADIHALADNLAAHAAAKDWAAASVTANDLARQRQRLSLGSWRLSLGTAVVACVDAAQIGGDWAPASAPGSAAARALPRAPSTPPVLPPQRAAPLHLAVAADDGWNRLAVASLRLLAAWFGLLTRYQRQHPKARMTAATSRLISRAVAGALQLARHTHTPATSARHPAQGPAESSASVQETTEHAAQTLLPQEIIPTPNHPAAAPSSASGAPPPQSSVDAGARAGGASVMASALAALGAALELMDDTSRTAATAAAHAALAVCSDPTAPSPSPLLPAPHPPVGTSDEGAGLWETGGGSNESSSSNNSRSSSSIRSTGTNWFVLLSERGVSDVFSAWVEFVTHTGGEVRVDGWEDGVMRLTSGLLRMCMEPDEMRGGFLRDANTVVSPQARSVPASASIHSNQI